MEDEMLLYWSNLMELEDIVQQKVEKIGMLDDLTLIPKSLETVVDLAVFALRKSGIRDETLLKRKTEYERDHDMVLFK